jgi:hypothetical protein
VNATPGKLIVTLAVAAAALAGLTAAVGASAAAGKGHTLFRYSGHLVAAPGAGATQVSVSIETGNKRALRSLIGHSQVQNFSVGSNTEFLRWTNGVPQVVSIGDLQAGDWVTVNVRAAARATLDEIDSTPAGIVGDRGPSPSFANQPLFQFNGTFAGASSAGAIDVHVTGGSRIALRALLGHSADQTFAYGDETIFLLWTGKVPTVISAAQLKEGDRIVVKIRAPRGTTLDQLEHMSAARVAEHERLS